MTMRDRRFVAVHRDGPLDRESHAILALWAADCAEKVLHFFKKASDDLRPKRAIETGRAWAVGKVKTGVAMKASLAAHAAARSVKEPSAIAAARAAGQAVATAHFADHCMGALLYALKIRKLSGQPVGRELKLQTSKLPLRLRRMVRDGVVSRLRKLGVKSVEKF